jgi:hypothetical protein
MLKDYIENANNGNVSSILFLANHYKENKKYPDMIKYYLIAIEIDNNDIAKEKLGKYFEYIKNDFNTAKNFYEKISHNNRHVKRIEEKCYGLVQIGMFNPIKFYKKCDLCHDKYVDIFKLKSCCFNKICIKCTCGIINKKYDFVCPFCRNLLPIENNVDLFDTNSECDC